MILDTRWYAPYRRRHWVLQGLQPRPAVLLRLRRDLCEWCKKLSPAPPPGHEDFVANLDDSAFFAQQLDIGDRVVARWSVEDVHLLRPERSREQGRAAVDRPYGEEFDRPPR